MNFLNGGYAMIKHNASQKDLADAYKSNKPVLVYDENQKAHWGQINEKVIETTDEETQETITTYEYSYQLLNDIASLVDSAGNPRFIEGAGTPMEMEGFTSSYCKWSLSGTHLMIVLCGSFANATVLPNDKVIAEFNLPQFIKDKIFTVWGSNIETRSVSCTAASWSTQTMNVVFYKENATGIMKIKTLSTALTFTDTRYFRVQFDLLIDAEYTE